MPRLSYPLTLFHKISQLDFGQNNAQIKLPTYPMPQNKPIRLWTERCHRFSGPLILCYKLSQLDFGQNNAEIKLPTYPMPQNKLITLWTEQCHRLSYHLPYATDEPEDEEEPEDLGHRGQQTTQSVDRQRPQQH